MAIELITKKESISLQAPPILDVSEAYENGRKDEYNEFWDSYQDYGKRTHYLGMFAYYGWNDKTFKPKYDIVPIGRGDSMYQYSEITDFEGILKAQGVKFDTSSITYFYNMFSNSSITHLGTINFTKAIHIYGVFYGCRKLKTIEKVIFKDGAYEEARSLFGSNDALEEVTVEGKIHFSQDMSSSKLLSKTSIISFINAFSDVTTSLVWTFSLAAVKKAFETNEGANDGSTSQEWLNLVATKPNWTISLI